MRKIEFRGKRVDNGEFVYGYYIKTFDNRHLIFTGEHGLIKSLPQDLSHHEEFTYFAVDPETIGQFTSLEDENGKQIYEGDIVLVNGEHYEVYYRRDGFGLISVSNLTGCSIPPLSFMYVIGNIHENPELLERENENEN
jgi:uncharacterized phage protein (TIGR01671 family)